ncbi:MAG TPA: S26 family signal peptidase, partial [Oscillospiraceae bacterium]|nr:S26 family signal peptidase [Oscillospiraceae bacterium]
MEVTDKLRPTVYELELELQRRRRFDRIRKALRNILIALLIVAAATILVAMLLLPVLQVHGTSMEPILKDGEVLIALRGQ